VRIVDADKIVRMMPVNVIKDDSLGVWVTGLPEAATVITVGQELVVAGDSVDITYEPEAEPVVPGLPDSADQTLNAAAGADGAVTVETAQIQPNSGNPS
jgi:ABC-type cobalamin transport system permease subunit